MARTQAIEVVPYNPEWAHEFTRIKEYLLPYVDDLILAVEHVGSTSVPGLDAKPIIDLDLVMASYDVLPEIIERLAKIGYVHEGNQGIEGREAFKRIQEDEFMKYHLFVCPQDGKGFVEHLALRDYLCSHEADRQAYAELKNRLAGQHRNDRDAYGAGKTAFIQAILEKARAGADTSWYRRKQ
ncbi:GrpB family protein [Paenibacillus donghaensis]|uniref:GrpB family protein n=1 Tax=Paenibacillus donghaensis TaxID=414771 RepID=UPI001FE587CC|nr:GrpB family protein [Paenibacillus donghaensis]